MAASVPQWQNWVVEVKTLWWDFPVVVQWLRIRLPTQGTQVWSLVQDDSADCETTTATNSHAVHQSYSVSTLEAMSHNPWACALQQEKHCKEKPTHHNYRVAPACLNSTRESLCMAMRTQSSQILKNKEKKKKTIQFPRLKIFIIQPFAEKINQLQSKTVY